MIQALVLTGDGINCEEETAFALTEAGATSTLVHINDLITNPAQLKQYQILAFPGGFSFGDEVSSGKILGIKLRHYLRDELEAFISQDKLIIGICNGFQALVKLGILPQSSPFAQQVTLTHNRQRRYINKWISMRPVAPSLFFKDLNQFMLPMRHGEGRLVVPEALESQISQHIALRYDEDVNGSFLQTAALINERGTVLGIMPHPEAFVRWTQHPFWNSLSKEDQAQTPAGQQIFHNMIDALRN